MWPKKIKRFCFQKSGIFFIENENIVTEYFLFLVLANFCTQKKTLMQRHRHEPSKKNLGRIFSFSEPEKYDFHRYK